MIAFRYPRYYKVAHFLNNFKTTSLIYQFATYQHFISYKTIEKTNFVTHSASTLRKILFLFYLLKTYLALTHLSSGGPKGFQLNANIDDVITEDIITCLKLILESVSDKKQMKRHDKL